MYISDLKLMNFRNYEEEQLEFSKGINLFVGDNAQGKTNLLEAVYYCSRGETFKSIRDSDLIRYGEQQATLDAQIIRDNRRKLIHIQLGKGQKSIRINDLKPQSIKEMKNQFDIVYFWPDHLRVIKEGPVFRRALLDDAIATLKPGYKQLLGKYMAVLSQRNKLIKGNTGIRFFMEQLRALTRQLAETGASLTLYRLNYAAELHKEMQKVHYNLSRKRETASIHYENCMDLRYGESPESRILAEELNAKMQANITEDLTRGYTTLGPHRDDLSILLDGKSAKLFSSQGQQRSLVLSLKLSELNLIKEYRRSEPILLLDDVFSELDTKRRGEFLEHIQGVQALITTNDLNVLVRELVGKEHAIYQIVQGRIQTRDVY